MIEEHYDDLVAKLLSGKDSIFEPCKILKFDPKTMTAHVYFTRSSKEKEDAVVLFPTMSATSLDVFVPTSNTTALAFWGADRQVFIMPAQYILPNYDVNLGVAKQNASLEQFDKDLSLEHLEPGEAIRRAHGSHLYMTIHGDIELMTRSLDFLRLEGDGMLRGGFDGSEFAGPMFEEASELIEVEGLKGQRKTLKLYRETPELVEQDPRDMGKEIVQLLALMEDPSSLDVIPAIPNDLLFAQTEGVVTSETDGVTEWKRLSPEERVVKEFKTERGTISIGEHGSIVVEREGFKLAIEDDVKVTLGTKRYSFESLIERIEALSTLAGIEEDLHDT